VPWLTTIFQCVETLPIALFTSTDSATAKLICFRSLVDQAQQTASILEKPTSLSLSLSPEEESPSSHH